LYKGVGWIQQAHDKVQRTSVSIKAIKFEQLSNYRFFLRLKPYICSFLNAVKY